MAEITMKTYQCGYCTQKESSFKKGGTDEVQRFYGNAVVMQTKEGVVVFDTGYSTHFMKAVQRLPYSIYAGLIPVYFNEAEGLRPQLEKEGIYPTDVKYIVVSHFHGDHYAGLRDFPLAKVICSKNAYDYVKNRKGIRAASKGFIPQLIPTDLESRLKFCEDKLSTELPSVMSPFVEGYKLFDNIFAVILEGHARGQIGLLVDNTFLIADAIWDADFYTENREQSRLADWITDNIEQQRINLNKIRQLHKSGNVNIVHGHKR